MKEFELEPGESIIIETRKHWFLFLAELLPYAIIAVIPFALPNVLGLVSLPPFSYAMPLGRAVLGIWLLVTWTGAWGTFTKYFLNAWILTDRRIVEIKQRRYFSREVSSLLLTRVQDVTTDVVGVLSSVLNIGTIKVQTAAEDVEFVMRGIPDPEGMRELILKYVPGQSQPPPTGV